MKPEAILVVDDDRDSRALLQYAFSYEAPDLPIDYVEDGKKAIAFLQHKPPYNHRPAPSLMLLDLKMPVMDGFEVLEWLQRCPEVRPPCIVVFTTSSHGGDRERAWQLGADGYLVKPISFAELREQASVLAFCARHGFWPPERGFGPDLRAPS